MEYTTEKLDVARAYVLASHGVTETPHACHFGHHDCSWEPRGQCIAQLEAMAALLLEEEAIERRVKGG